MGKRAESMGRFAIREGTPGDVPVILRFIRELAEYEGIGHRVTATEEGLLEALFGEAPAAETLLASVGGARVSPSSTRPSPRSWARGAPPGRPLHKPKVARQGPGNGVLRRLAAIAVQRGCGGSSGGA